MDSLLPRWLRRRPPPNFVRGVQFSEPPVEWGVRILDGRDWSTLRPDVVAFGRVLSMGGHAYYIIHSGGTKSVAPREMVLMGTRAAYEHMSENIGLSTSER